MYDAENKATFMQVKKAHDEVHVALKGRIEQLEGQMHKSVDDITQRKDEHQKHEDRMCKLEAQMHKSVDDNVARYGENQKTLTSLQAVMATDPINRAQQQEQANIKHAADSAALKLKIQEA